VRKIVEWQNKCEKCVHDDGKDHFYDCCDDNDYSNYSFVMSFSVTYQLKNFVQNKEK
jgi:hypothetical protein